MGFDAKAVRPTDVFRGAISFEPISRLEAPGISRRWMWSELGCELLSRRLDEKIREAGDHGAFLEVGTLTRIDPALGAHYQIVDMTIAQAYAAGRFGFDKHSTKDIEIAQNLQAETLRRAKHVFAFSEWARQSVYQDCGVPLDRISVVYTGPNFEAKHFAPRPRKAQRVLFMGYDWDRKGGPQLLEAFRIVRKALPQAELYIVGNGPRTAEPGVTLAGTFDRRTPEGLEQILSAYSECSCLCLPSRFDPFPIAIVDAMTFGTPVVAFENGSRKEAVIDGVTGRLAPEGDIEALAAALVSILSDTDLRDAMSAECLKRSKALFTWKRVVERIGEVVARDSGAVAAHDSAAAGSVACAR
jgi:glycosyltransferase involved in cell wall biosynthesis